MSYQRELPNVNHNTQQQDDFEMVENNIPAYQNTEVTGARERTTRTKQTNPSNARQRERDSYLSHLANAFANRRTSQHHRNSENPRTTDPSPPPTPTNSRRASTSSSSSEDTKIGALGNVFAAALAFGESCTRQTERRTMNVEPPIAQAYNYPAYGGFAAEGPRKRRLYKDQKEDDVRQRGTPVIKDLFGFSSLVNTMFRKGKK